jgi:hypothetical protein
MVKKYSCKRGRLFGIVLLTGCLVIIGFAYGLPFLSDEIYSFKEFIITTVFVIPVPGLFLWCWLGTYYLIDNETLIARCGPFIRRVLINDITLIRLNQRTISGIWKPTLSFESIEVQYKTDRSIYITPQNQDDFLSELKNTNDKIKIMQK